MRLLREAVLPARTAVFVREEEAVVRFTDELVLFADEAVLRVPLVLPLLLLLDAVLPDTVRTFFLIYDGSCGPEL